LSTPTACRNQPAGGAIRCFGARSWPLPEWPGSSDAGPRWPALSCRRHRTGHRRRRRSHRQPRCLPRAVFDRVGGFDEGYFLHAEDLDLCRRVRDGGMRVACVNAIKVMHGKGGSSRHRPLFVARHKHRGLWRWFVKFDPAARNPLLRTAVWIGLWSHFAALLPINAWRQARAGAQR
jgi:hypothetical protein